MDTLGKFSAMFYKGDNFCDFLFDLRNKRQVPSEKGSVLKGKNLLGFVIHLGSITSYFLSGGICTFLQKKISILSKI